MIRTLSTLAVILCGMHATDAFAATPPGADCIVRYEHGEGASPDLGKRIQLLPNLPKPLPEGQQAEIVSEQATSRMTVYRSNTTRPGPWVTVIAFTPGGGAASTLKVSDALDVQARWINEKLAFIRIWWGRMASSDMIFDAHRAAFIYREFAHYGALHATECD